MFEVRDVSSLPIPQVPREEALESYVHDIIKIKQGWISRSEPSAIYTCFLPGSMTLSVAEFVNDIRLKAEQQLIQLQSLQASINSLIESSVELSSVDRDLLQNVLGEPPLDSVSEDLGPQCFWICHLLSYAAGAAFGRWDIRDTTGAQAVPELPDPFAPLPLCPPGMLQNAQGLPIAPSEVPPNYPLRISWPGIQVDDQGQSEDIEGRVREGLQVICKERSEAIEQEACQILGVRSLRDYFRKPAGFFADHLRRYLKSRRQAPIYWPLSTPSGAYTLWLYYHRLTEESGDQDRSARRGAAG